MIIIIITIINTQNYNYTKNGTQNYNYTKNDSQNYNYNYDYNNTQNYNYTKNDTQNYNNTYYNDYNNDAYSEKPIIDNNGTYNPYYYNETNTPQGRELIEAFELKTFVYEVNIDKLMGSSEEYFTNNSQIMNIISKSYL